MFWIRKHDFHEKEKCWKTKFSEENKRSGQAEHEQQQKDCEFDRVGGLLEMLEVRQTKKK